MKRINKKRFAIIVSFILGIVLLLSNYLIYLKTRPLVSAILINQIYDSDSVKKLFDAFLNQDIQNVEIIVVSQNDADSLELEQVYKNDKRFSFYDGTGNIPKDMNFALKKSKGKYLYFMNPAFMPKQNQLTQQLSYFDTYEKLDAVGAQNQNVEETLITFSHSVEESPIRVMFQIPVEHYMTLIDGDFVRFHNIKYDESLPALWAFDFWQRFVEKGGRVRACYDELFDSFIGEDHHKIIDKTTGMSFESDLLTPSADPKQIKETYQRLLSKYIDISDDKENVFYPIGPVRICQLLENLDAKKYDFTTFNFLKRRICKASKIKHYPISHPQWEDTLILEDESRMCLKYQGTCGSYQLKNDVLKIKWDNYGTEYFVLKLEGNFVYVDKNE